MTLSHVLLVVALMLSSSAHGWTTSNRQLDFLAPFVRHHRHFPDANLPSFFVLAAAVSGSGGGDAPVSTELERSDNPCWQDMYDSDDDCLSNIASASFVASKWIQSMPCGAGIEDCDMPTDLQMPETRPEGGVDNVDVMEFLGIKRPESLKAHHDSDDTVAPPTSSSQGP